MRFLRQSTAVKVPVGPFLDVTDGATPETGITLGAADQAELMKHDASATVSIAGNTFAAISDNAGMYNLTLSDTDTNTCGVLHVHIGDVSVCRPVSHVFMVIPANIYDSLIAGTDYALVDVHQVNGNASSGLLSGTDHLKADVTKVSGDATAADKLEALLEAVTVGTVGTGSTTTSVVTGLTETTNDHYNGKTLAFRSGNLAGQSATISDYAGGSGTITVPALTEAPANGDTFIIY
jgi:hypothetical protein